KSHWTVCGKLAAVSEIAVPITSQPRLLAKPFLLLPPSSSVADSKMRIRDHTLDVPREELDVVLLHPNVIELSPVALLLYLSVFFIVKRAVLLEVGIETKTGYVLAACDLVAQAVKCTLY
ncbi:MAG: hypothetical protein ABW298_10995, partial [Candidatus Binatia bacterium]